MAGPPDTGLWLLQTSHVTQHTEPVKEKREEDAEHILEKFAYKSNKGLLKKISIFFSFGVGLLLKLK